MATRKRGLWLGMALTALVLAGCSEKQDAQAPGQGKGQPPPPLPAQVLEVEPQNLPVDKEYSALLRSEQQVTVVARVTGTLEHKHYEAGTRVEKGQLLFTIEPARYEATVLQRQADLQSAEAELSQARRNWERYQRLYEQNSVSQQQLDEAKAALLMAQASVAQAEAALDEAHLDLDYTTIEAPVAGQISLSNVNVGNLVQPPQELATITPLQIIEARFALPPEDAAALRLQRQAAEERTVTPVAIPSTTPSSGANTLDGRLTYLGASVDPDTGTVHAQATFDNPQKLLLPGQFIRVRLDGLVLPNVIAVPEIAVLEGREGPMVYVVGENGHANPVNVSLGERAGLWIVIDSGLQPGQRVIVSKVASVKPDRRIDPQPFDGDADAVSREGAELETQTSPIDEAATPPAEPQPLTDDEEGDAPVQAQEGEGA